MIKGGNREKVFRYLYFAAAAFLILLLASRSSFLYVFNNWDDANSYFSLGKAIFNGKMPYRDVFDQKGMLLYFLYGLCYLVSHTTFAGVFVMEILWAFFDIWGFYRILTLYVKKPLATVLAPVSLALVFCSRSFYWGGAAEELCFPFLVWGLYLGLRYFKTEYPAKAMDKKTLFIAGLLAGCVANIKFTVLGFFFAWMMWVAFAYLTRRDLKGAVAACGIFLGGMALPFVPWFIYFGVQGGLYYWYWGTIYINVFLYSNLDAEGPGLAERVYTLAKILYWLILVNWMYYIAIIPGVIYSIFEKGLHIFARFFVPVLCFFSFVGIYIGGSELPYYALPLGVFSVLGIALLGVILQKLYELSRKKIADRYEFSLKFAGCLAVLVFSMVTIWTYSENTEYMQVKQEDIFLYKFRDIITESENPTLLNISCLDAGLYTLCDIVPTCQWFQTQTINDDMVLEEQARYMREGLTEYVIARDWYPEVVLERYELVGEEVFPTSGGVESTYYLFKRID